MKGSSRNKRLSVTLLCDLCSNEFFHTLCIILQLRFDSVLLRVAEPNQELSGDKSELPGRNGGRMFIS